MWQQILSKFRRYPAQEKVARLILSRGFQINERGRVASGSIEILTRRSPKSSMLIEEWSTLQRWLFARIPSSGRYSKM